MTQNKLHILFLTSWYPSKVLPVNGDFIERHADAVATLHRVSILHVITNPQAIKPIEIDIQKSSSKTAYIAYVKKSKNPFVKLLRFYKAYKILLHKIESFDVIHLNKLYPAGIVALFLNIFYNKKYLISEHWSGYQVPFNLQISSIVKFLSTKIVKKAAYVCPVSQHLANAMQDFGLKGNYHPIPNVVMTDIFVPSKKVNKKLKLIHISSLFDEVKNIKGIIRVLGALKNKHINFDFHFIGGQSSEFKSILKENKLDNKEVQFVDFLEQNQLVKYLQQADAFLLFSNYENLPCVILEAFSTGIPVISTNVGGIAEYFPENFGTLIPAANEDALLQAIIDLPNKDWETPLNMHTYAEDHFSPAIIAARFDALYQKMTD